MQTLPAFLVAGPSRFENTPAMINAPALLRDLKRLTATLEADLRECLAATPALDAALAAEWQAARDAARTGATLHDFREDALTQAAVHWLLMGVSSSAFSKTTA